MPKVLILRGGFAYKEMFLMRGWEVVDTVDEADLVQFCGGPDVNPTLYGERVHPQTKFDAERDEEERQTYLKAVHMEKPMVGICRGAQFLHVMNGGKLWQHVNHHAVAGTHSVCDLDSSRLLGVTSTHHQMMRENDSGRTLAICRQATVKESMSIDGHVIRCTKVEDDIEAIYYDLTDCLCFQPHPEHGRGVCQDYYFNLIRDYMGFKLVY